MFTFDSKHTRSRYKIRAQQQRETFGVVNRRQFGANYIPIISFHSQAPHVQGHFEIWKQVFTDVIMEPPCCFVTSRNALFNRHAMHACQLFIAHRAHPRDCAM